MSSSIELTIDGHKVEVPRGTSLYWAARKAGIEIPHICYGEDIPAMSACRVCVVEVEGMRKSRSILFPILQEREWLCIHGVKGRSVRAG